MTKKILIMGLPGSGKSFYSDKLRTALKDNPYREIRWFCGEVVRRNHDDWDFTDEGRLRQCERMRDFAERADVEIVICEMVAPLALMRESFEPDWLIWVDTVPSSQYPDTDAVFDPPIDFDFRITKRDDLDLIKQIANAILTNNK